MSERIELSLTQQDFLEHIDSAMSAIDESAALITDDQFMMRIVQNAEQLQHARSKLEFAMKAGTPGSGLEYAVQFGILLGLRQALPVEYHAVRRATRGE